MLKTPELKGFRTAASVLPQGIDILLKTSSAWFWPTDDRTDVEVRVPLIGTQFSISRHLCPSFAVLHRGNPAVAECVFDQTLLTASVDNPGNSSSSPPLDAMKSKGGEAFSESVLILAVSAGVHM